MFLDASLVGSFSGTAASFKAGNESRSFTWIDDTVFLGRQATPGPGGKRASVALQEVVVHEMTHARNIDGDDALSQIQDTDANAYADPALAVARTAASGPTNDVLGAFVAEIVARHVTWITRKELAGTPGTLAVRALPAEDLAAAALFYFRDVPSIYDSNQYGAGINAQGDAARFRQLELWLLLCATQSFSDVATDNTQSVLAFQAAAQVCADQVTNPTLNINQMDGLFPLAADFVNRAACRLDGFLLRLLTAGWFVPAIPPEEVERCSILAVPVLLLILRFQVGREDSALRKWPKSLMWRRSHGTNPPSPPNKSKYIDTFTVR